MKWKFTSYLFVCAILAAGAAGGIQVLGQSGRDQNRSQNSGQYNGPTDPNANYASNPLTIGNFTAPQSGIPSTTYQRGPAVPFQGMPGYGPSRFTVVNKDGTIERIEKGPGVQLSKEEFDQINETRQKIQNAVSQIRSPDADESKKKDAKEFIAKYLKAEFQADQESRREQVERLEKQVEQLRKQLSKRDESQDKLIELRMQLLENDASGLSFPDSWGNISGPAPTHYYPTPHSTSSGTVPQPYNPNPNHLYPPSYPPGAPLLTPSHSYPAPKNPNPDEANIPFEPGKKQKRY